MKTQIRKTAVMSLALIAMTFFTFSSASAQRGNQDRGQKQKTKKTVVTKRKVVTQKNQRTNQRGRVASYPRGSKQMTHKGINYRVSGNQYYRMQHGRYVRVAPPRGMYYTSMPKGHTRVQRNGGTYYRHNGQYYQRQRNHLGQFIFMLMMG